MQQLLFPHWLRGASNRYQQRFRIAQRANERRGRQACYTQRVSPTKVQCKRCNWPWKKKLEKPTPGKLNYEWFEGVFRKATLDL